MRLIFLWLATNLALTCVRGDNVLVRPWGENTLRIQVSPSDWTLTDEIPSAILPGSVKYGSALPSIFDSPIESGNLRATMRDDKLSLSKVSDGSVLLKETARTFGAPGSEDSSSITFNFESSATKLYGMGQNRHVDNGGGLGLNVVGNSYDFQESLNEEGGPSNSLPYVIAADPSKGFQFGVLFNSPSLGGANFSNTTMTWILTGDAGNQRLRRQLDFLISTHAADATPAERPFQIIEKYVDAVGHARKMPFPGYWHSKNRYSTQDQLLTAARGFYNRSIPVDVIVIDWFHWKIMGDWSFNPTDWPDPQAMVDECRSYGMEIMVSVWPFTCPGSRSYNTTVKNNWIATRVADDGSRTDIPIETHGKNCYNVDPTSPEFRKYAWSLIESGYHKYGIKIFWLDASEPEGMAYQSTNASWSLGTMRDMGAMFTWYWTQVFHDGLVSAGDSDIVMLPRAGWVGTWRWGAALWSGDIRSTMDSLKSQLNIGLSAQSSGIPWWTTDDGGYAGGNSADPTYREIIVRWFQYGMTCPMFRQHGARDHTAIWWYGPEDEKLLGDIIKLRASMKTYISAQLDALNATGRPFNRPLMWDFPEDPLTWKLAEGGIGDPSSPTNTSAHAFQNGDLVLIDKCSGSWDESWTISNTSHGVCVHLTNPVAANKCLDNGGAPGGPPPDGPFPIHMWQPGFARSQDWVYDKAKQMLADPLKKVCLTAAGDGKHPTISRCDPSDEKQRWIFENGGPIKNGDNCLRVVSSAKIAPVADQYMMGDDYMVAPILNLGQRARKVYFPKGANWKHHYTGTVYKGGTTATVNAPLDTFPLFLKQSDNGTAMK